MQTSAKDGYVKRRQSFDDSGFAVTENHFCLTLFSLNEAHSSHQSTIIDGVFVDKLLYS